jgi:hypothetical protein
MCEAQGSESHAHRVGSECVGGNGDFLLRLIAVVPNVSRIVLELFSLEEARMQMDVRAGDLEGYCVTDDALIGLSKCILPSR